MNVSVKDFRMWTKIYFQNFSLTLADIFFQGFFFYVLSNYVIMLHQRIEKDCKI